jgi:ABC-type transport system involved in multi-copper enzyme maturation permease subunit
MGRGDFLNGAIFVGLNLADAQFTKIALADGAIEIMPFAQFFGSSLLAKGLLALAVVALLVLFRKPKLLRPLNIGIGTLAAWGCVVAYLFPVLF